MKGFAGRRTCSGSGVKGEWDEGDSLLCRVGEDSVDVHGDGVGERIKGGGESGGDRSGEREANSNAKSGRSQFDVHRVSERGVLLMGVFRCSSLYPSSEMPSDIA